MSQLHARLFEKWVHTSGDLTYDEWISRRREEGKRAHEMKRAAKMIAPVFHHQQTMQQAMGNQQLVWAQQQMQRMLGGGFGMVGGGPMDEMAWVVKVSVTST